VKEVCSEMIIINFSLLQRQELPNFFFLVLLPFSSRIMHLHEGRSGEGKKNGGRECVNWGRLWNPKRLCNWKKLAGAGMRSGVMEEGSGKVAKREGAGKEPILN